MIDINNKEIRTAIIAKYLEAETSVAEERLLVEYFQLNSADEDEKAVAAMIHLEHHDALLFSDNGVEEYHRIVAWKSVKPHKYTRYIAIGLCSMAAGIALLLILNLFALSKEEHPMPFATIEIAENIQQILNLNMDEVTSITASPVQECVLLTATLSDGSTKLFVMSKDTVNGETTLLAIN